MHLSVPPQHAIPGIDTRPGPLRAWLTAQGAIFQTSSDTEVFLHLYARSRAASIDDAIVESVSQAQGAFSLVFLTKDRLVAVRDPHGFRPLALGRLGDGWVVCSETCAMDLIGATYVRDVEPGELLIIGPEGPVSRRPYAAAAPCHCVFEHVYFSRPDSETFGERVWEVRRRIGAQLAAKDADLPVGDDLVVFFAHPASKEVTYPLRHGQALSAQPVRWSGRLRRCGYDTDLDLEFRPGESVLAHIAPSGHVALQRCALEPAPAGDTGHDRRCPEPGADVLD